MPIRESEKARYPENWPDISRRIRDREGNRCKWCQVPNGARICRLIADPAQWALGLDVAMGTRGPLDLWHDPITIVLTCAHLDHVPEHNSPENLAALCQRCHLRYDARHHAASARETRDRRSGQRWLF